MSLTYKLVKVSEPGSDRYGPPSGGGGSGGGGGGHTEPVGNNLSFPVIWADGTPLALRGTFGQPMLTVPYSETTTYPFDTNADGLADTNAYAFAQKTVENSWQAQSSAASGPVYVSQIDWGDSLESVDMKVGRPVRVELTLYKTLTGNTEGLPETMLAFPMTMLANPSSPDEVQGAGGLLTESGYQALTYQSAEATVYSAGAKLIIQKLVGTRENVKEGDLQWTGSQWEDAIDNSVDSTDIEDPLTGITFAGELNVGGKVIGGLSQGGWKPKEIGDYRITFYIAPNANAQLDYATIRVAAEEEIAAIAAEEGGGGGGDAVVIPDLNLTYIDVRVVAGGGGGGGGKGRPRAAELMSLGGSEIGASKMPFFADTFFAGGLVDPLRIQDQVRDQLAIQEQLQLCI